MSNRLHFWQFLTIISQTPLKIIKENIFIRSCEHPRPAVTAYHHRMELDNSETCNEVTLQTTRRKRKWT